MEDVGDARLGSGGSVAPKPSTLNPKFSFVLQALKTSATHGTERRGAAVEDPAEQEATRSMTDRGVPDSVGKDHRQNCKYYIVQY